MKQKVLNPEILVSLSSWSTLFQTAIDPRLIHPFHLPFALKVLHCEFSHVPSPSLLIHKDKFGHNFKGEGGGPKKESQTKFPCQHSY
jgi:hypothetical protein